MPDSSSFQLVIPANAFLDKHLRTADNSVLLPALPQDLCCTNPNGGVETALSAIIRKTQTQTAVDSLPYQHYRLVLWSIGRPLTTFRCTKELVTGVLDTMKVYCNVVEILQCDISVGNILLTDEGKGILIDWELAKRTDKVGSRQFGRVGTWCFLSANMIMNPKRTHALVDDIESFIHVLGWTTLRFLPPTKSYTAIDRSRDMYMFDEDFWCQGGKNKCHTLETGRYPSKTFEPRESTPLWDLLQILSSPFKSLYADPPRIEIRKEYEELKREFPHDEEVYRSHLVQTYERDMERLASYSWFITTIEDALAKVSWPTDDRAVRGLLISEVSLTNYQKE